MNTISSNVTQNGLIGGLVVILLRLTLYVVDPKLLFDPLLSALPYLVIFPTFMIIATLADRKAKGGYIKMEEGFKSAFLTGTLALFLFLSFEFIMQSVIDPSLVGLQKEQTVEMTINMIEKFSDGSADADQIDEMVAEIENADYTPSLGNTIIGFLVSALLGAIPALITAAIFRKLPPVGHERNEDLA